MNKVFKICFFLFSVLCGMESNKNHKNGGWYRKFLDNRNVVGISTSAIVGGGIGAGLKYLLHKNTFLSSFRAAEKIKHASYFKFVSAGAITAFGLYELLKRLTKPKQSDNNEEKKSEIDYKKTIQVLYICQDNLYSLFQSKDGLETEIAKQIEDKLSKGEIKKYNKNQFGFCSSQKRYSATVKSFLKNSDYVAALYLINEDQKESFKNKCTQEKSFLYNLYEIDKPNLKKNLLCYALPLESSVDEKNNKTYSSLQISSETEANIDSYSFKLTEADASKIDLNKKDFYLFEMNIKYRTNKQNVSDSSDY